MDPITMLMLGGSAVKGLSSLFGSRGASKAAQRGQEQANAEFQRHATDAEGDITTGYGSARGDLSRGFDDARRSLSGGYGDARTDISRGAMDATRATNRAGMDATRAIRPYQVGGNRAFGQMNDALGVNGGGAQRGYFQNFQDDPGFQAAMDAGQNAVAHNAIFAGRGNSGATEKDLYGYGQRARLGAFQQRLENLRQVANTGFQASSQAGDIARWRGGQLGDIARWRGGAHADLATRGGTAMADLDRTEGGSLADLGMRSSDRLADIALKRGGVGRDAALGVGQARATGISQQWNALGDFAGNAAGSFGYGQGVSGPSSPGTAANGGWSTTVRRPWS